MVHRRVPRRDGAGPRRGPIMRSRRPRLLVPLVAAMLVAAASGTALATFPFPQKGGDVYDYTRLHIDHGDCPPAANGDLPKNFDCKNEFKLTDYAPQPGDADYDPTVANNPQELFGVKGSGTNHAWEVTTGRPDTVIAVEDSGIIWNSPELVNKVHLKEHELPVPCV